MTAQRLVPFAVALVAMFALCAFLFGLQANGYESTSNLDQWGRSLLARSGGLSFADVVTAFPPIALIAMICLDWLAPQLGPLTPLVLSAALASALLTSWFSGMRAAGLGTRRSLIATALLGINPAFLHAVSEGAGIVLTLWGLWLLAIGMFNLRQETRTNDIILVAGALVLLGFSEPFGLIAACAAIPFLSVVVPPDLLAKSTGGVFIVLLFPFAFSVAGFLYVNWLFTGDPMHFSATFGQGAAGVDLRARYGPVPAPSVALAVAGLLLANPLGLWSLARFRRVGPLHRGTLAILGFAVSSILIGWAAGDLPAPAVTAGLVCSLAAATGAVCARYSRLRRVIVPALFAGLVGGSIVTFADHTAPTGRWRAAALSHRVAPLDPELRQLGLALRDRQGILFDAASAPIAVAARRTADGIHSAQSHAFRLASLTGRFNAPFLVVRSAESETGADALGRIFPGLFQNGAAGYRLIFDGLDWRIYAADVEKTP